MIRAHTFSGASRQLHVLTSSFLLSFGLYVSFVIGYSDYFGFDFTELNWQPPYYYLILVIMFYLMISVGAAFPFGIPRGACGDGVKIVCCSWQAAENTISWSRVI